MKDNRYDPIDDEEGRVTQRGAPIVILACSLIAFIVLVVLALLFAWPARVEGGDAVVEIPGSVLDSEEYQDQLDDAKALLERALSARKSAPRLAALKHGSGFTVGRGTQARIGFQKETRCSAFCDLGCGDPRRPVPCPRPNCGLVINLTAPVHGDPPGPSPLDSEMVARYLRRPGGCSWIGEFGERLDRNWIALSSACLAGEHGPGWDCSPTWQEVYDLSTTTVRGTGFYARWLPVPVDTDRDGFPDAVDDCPLVRGVAPRGCPATPPPVVNPPLRCFLVGEPRWVPGLNSTGTLENLKLECRP